MPITNKQIDTEIATFTTDRDKLRAHAQKILMMIFMHAAPKAVSKDCDGSGDCTRAIKLLKQLPKSWEPQANAWLKEFTPIRVVVKSDKCEYTKEYKALAPADKPAAWDIEGANATNFWEVIEEPAPKILTFKELVAMVERIGKTIDKKIEEEKVAPEDVESAKSIAAVISALRFERVKPVEPAANEEESEEEPAPLKNVA